MAIINTPLLGLPYAGADTDETYAVLAGLFVKDGKKLTLPEIVEKYTPTVGTVHIKAADWTAADGTEDAYDAKIKIKGVEAQSVILIYPFSSADTEKAKRLGIRAKTLSGSANDDTFVIVRATGGAPTVADGISLVYIAFRGYPVWNEGLTPPATPYATVIGVDPYIATEEGDRDDIAASQRLVTEAFTELRISLSTLFAGWADTNKAVELRLKSADLPTKLDEYRAAKGLIDNTVSDLVNYYTKSQTLTKEEINALVSAIPKFKIEVVTSLPTSNISDTTVYLVKSGDDDTNLYTEYIRTGGKWEKLGTQTVDLTGYATEAWVNDILAAYVKTVDMEAYVAGLLKSYITKDVADETYQPAGDYPTADEMDEAISEATKDLAPKSSIPTVSPWAQTPDKPTYTADEISGLADKIRSEISAAGTELPFVFVDSIPADADTSKLYVIDGKVWAWMRKHNANDGTCQANARPSSDPTISSDLLSDNGCLTTAPIQLDKTKSSNVVNLSGLDKLYTNFYSPCYVYYFKEDGSSIGYVNPGNPSSGLGAVLEGDTLPLPSTFDVSKRADYFGKATQIRIMFGITANAAISASDYENFVINCEWLDTTEGVWDWYSTGQRLFDDTTTKKNTADIANLQERMDVVEEALGSGTVASPLFGKLGLIGDSLTNQEYQGWQALVVSMLGIAEWHKNAITGSTVARYPRTTLTPFVERYLDTPEDCDCVVIMGGTNDASNLTDDNMGEAGVLNNDTFKGAYSTIIEGLLTRNPATRVMLVTPPRSYTQADKTLKVNIGKCAEATKEIAQYYGLPCLDFYNTLGWNKATAEWCSWDFAAGDTVHFSKAIGPRVGRMVANFIRQNY